VSEDLQAKPSKSGTLMQRLMIYAAVLLIVFLLGFVPMWLKARAATNNLAEAEHKLVLSQTQNDLASAVIDARRGDYEPARQALSRFFNSLSAATGSSANYTEAQRQSMQPLMAGRDELITLLARNDPSSADRLADLFVAYRKIVSG